MNDLSKIDLQDDAAIDAPENLDPAQNLTPAGADETTEETPSGGTYY